MVLIFIIIIRIQRSLINNKNFKSIDHAYGKLPIEKLIEHKPYQPNLLNYPKNKVLYQNGILTKM
jgi:hypothetical protein